MRRCNTHGKSMTLFWACFPPKHIPEQATSRPQHCLLAHLLNDADYASSCCAGHGALLAQVPTGTTETPRVKPFGRPCEGLVASLRLPTVEGVDDCHPSLRDSRRRVNHTAPWSHRDMRESPAISTPGRVSHIPRVLVGTAERPRGHSGQSSLLTAMVAGTHRKGTWFRTKPVTTPPPSRRDN